MHLLGARHTQEQARASRLDVSPSAVEMLGGHTSRQKRVFVAGVSADRVLTLLDAASVATES